MVWSPPRVMTRGRVLPFFAGPFLWASVAGARVRMELWPSSIWVSAQVLSYLANYTSSVQGSQGDLPRKPALHS